jgi:outer membrane protein assembly factor BamB
MYATTVPRGASTKRIFFGRPVLLRRSHRLLFPFVLAALLAITLGFGVNRTTTDAATPSNVRVLTYHNDVGRTGQNLLETVLTPSSVSSRAFGKVGFFATDGLVDAEPLYVSNLMVAGHPHNVVFVATEHDSVYAFDADTLAELWRVTVLLPNETPSDDRHCAQVSPEMGITATPVISLIGEEPIMYLVAMSKDGEGNYFQRLHALDITNGAEIPGSPTTIEAEYPNLQGSITFDPKQYKERAALLLQHGIIYTTWASHCDEEPYTGWIIGYNAASLQQANVLNITPNGADGAIWMSGCGPAADAQGNIYFLDGNGTFDTDLDASGFPLNGDFGNAFLKLSNASGKLTVADYFDSYATKAESDRDADLGSGGALLLPDLQSSSGKTIQLALGAGKTNKIYVVDRNALGKFNAKSDSGLYQRLDHALVGPVFSTPAYFNNTVYFAAVNDTLKAFAIENAKLNVQPASHSTAHFAYPGATPSVSANGDSDGIVWAVEARGSDAGVLHAYDASDLTRELYSSAKTNGRDAFSDNKFITPMIANGRVFVGTLTGVAVFGLLK